MKYRKDRYGNEISILGFGCMRLTRKDVRVDIEKAASEIRAAYEAGINYFDTAWAYIGNEEAMGEIFEMLGIRGQVNIAAKLPQYRVRKTEDFDRYLLEELRRLRTDHVEYYLMHMLNDSASLERLNALGFREWTAAKKEAGQIGQIGFSYHGNAEEFCRLLDAYDWDFCQIQYNYFDENSQAGRKGLEYAASKGIPVIIMEPLRGGKLSVLPAGGEKLLEDYPIRRSPSVWSFGWLWDQPGVTCVLSGMNSLEMIRENTEAASAAEAGMLSPEDRELLRRTAELIRGRMKVGCTGCRYCMPCPHGVDIPMIFTAYNDYYGAGRFLGLKEYFMCAWLRKNKAGISGCIGCGACEKKCPQQLPIRQELKAAAAVLETPPLKLFYRCSGLIMKY